jgi:hypothetical protein
MEGLCFTHGWLLNEFFCGFRDLQYINKYDTLFNVILFYWVYYASIVCTMHLLSVLCSYCLYCVSIVCTMCLLPLLDAGLLST